MAISESKIIVQKVLEETKEMLAKLEKEDTIPGLEQVESLRLVMEDTELEIDLKSLYSKEQDQKTHLRLWKLGDKGQKEQKEYLLEKEDEIVAPLRSILEKILKNGNTTPEEMIEALENDWRIKNK